MTEEARKRISKAMSDGGDTLLDMGESVKIYDLALKMIQFLDLN